MMTTLRVPSSAADQDEDDLTAINMEEDATATVSTKEETPLLFMDGLPSDFATNPQLAALASLMNDDDDDADDAVCNKKDDGDDEPVVKLETKKYASGGGGKVTTTTRKSSQQRRRKESSPYNTTTTTTRKKATMGEAQLFLKMWSLK